MWQAKPGSLLAGAVIAALALSGCAPEDAATSPEEEQSSPETASPQTSDAETDQTPHQESDDAQETSSQPEESEEPEYAVEDEFWRANTLPDPVAETLVEAPSRREEGELASAKMQVLSLDSDEEFTRLVLAWLEPEDGPRLAPEAIRAAGATLDPDKPWVRLVDRENGELIEPLRAEDRFPDLEAEPDVEDVSDDPAAANTRGFCICSSATSGDLQSGSSTYLMFIDFPTPESENVDVLAGQWAEPLTDVALSTDEPFELPDDGLSEFAGSNTELPDVYGAGALYERRVPLSARSQSLTGVTTVVDRETQEVSLPADVLFEFGEDSLSSEAESIIADAAEKLNAEATGQTVVVEGHTDNVDGHDINQPLSENRAEVVADEIEPLLDEGITLETVGHSFNQPLVPNEDADGNDLPENRELNRRVSFRYEVVDEDSGTEIDLGYEEIEELDEAEEMEAAEGAAASYVLQSAEEDQSDLEVRFDLLGSERDGDTVTMRFAVADPSGEGFSPDAFGYSRDHAYHFGTNPYFTASHPTAGEITIVDEEAEQQHFPVTAGTLNCLCTEVAAAGAGLGAEPSPMYAEFQLPQNLSSSLTLRIADSNELTLPDSFADELADAEG
ncbi:OmpA family protein [Garicola koreensis]|nr:OmpA family protein [Garicola koreensis]